MYRQEGLSWHILTLVNHFQSFSYISQVNTIHLLILPGLIFERIPSNSPSRPWSSVLWSSPWNAPTKWIWVLWRGEVLKLNWLVQRLGNGKPVSSHWHFSLGKRNGVGRNGLEWVLNAELPDSRTTDHRSNEFQTFTTRPSNHVSSA